MKKETFIDKDDANIECLHRIENTSPKHWCPLARERCNPECINIIQPAVCIINPYSSDDYNYKISRWWCDNPNIIVGE